MFSRATITLGIGPHSSYLLALKVKNDAWLSANKGIAGNVTALSRPKLKTLKQHKLLPLYLQSSYGLLGVAVKCLQLCMFPLRMDTEYLYSVVFLLFWIVYSGSVSAEICKLNSQVVRTHPQG